MKYGMYKKSIIIGLFLLLCMAVQSSILAAEARQEQSFSSEKKEKGVYKTQSAEKVILKDVARNKKLELRIIWPEAEGRFPVILFSHGMFGSKDGYEPLAQYWAEHGYVVIRPTHEDSLALMRRKGEKIDRNALIQHMKALQGWESRIDDIELILNSLPDLPSLARGLGDRMDASRIGMGGHSFGAFTSQLIGGATIEKRSGETPAVYSDPRPKAFVLLSPQGQSPPGLHENSWQNFTRPQLTVTGSEDFGRGEQKPEWRTEPYKRSPSGDKYLLFLDKASHKLGGISGRMMRHLRSKTRSWNLCCLNA
ncbi:MAG: alpha/beta hydrolase family protein, partial [Candidatus Sumerlaeota bacterium]